MKAKEQAEKISRGRKSLYAFFLTFGGLLFLEMVFRAGGVFSPLPPFTEFEDGTGRVQVRFNWNHLRPEFAREKAVGVFRIMIAGESTTVGFPYHPRSTFGLRLAFLLEDALPGRRVEVIHIGKMSMHSGEVAQVVESAVKYHPDVMIVYSGQNEFHSLPRRFSPAVTAILRTLEQFRVAQALGKVGVLVVGGSMLKLVQAWEEDPEGGLALPPPVPLPAKDYQRAFREYRQNLEKMVTAAQSAHVPLVLCTMTVNLLDWFPDFQSYPPDWPRSKKADAWKTFERAEAMMRAGRITETLALLSATGQEYQGYAPLSFLLGRARSFQLREELTRRHLPPDSTGWPVELIRLRETAVADLQRAVDEEVKTTMSHRAPPEFNAIIREMGRRPGVWIFDTDRLFLSAAALPPGFDLFEDHCHPNLIGQQLFAEGLFEFFREHNLPAEAASWKTPDFREEIFDNLNQVDDDFLHHVYLSISIWLGLCKRLPDHCAYVRQRFHLVSLLKPDDPMPVILENIYALTYGDSATPRRRMADWFNDHHQHLQKCLNRYFTSAVELRQGVLVARLNFDPNTPPLRGLLKSGLFFQDKDKKAKDRNVPQPLEYYTSFLDLAAGGVVITEQVKDRLRRRPPAAKAQELTLADAATGTLLSGGGGAHLLRMSKTAEYQIPSAESFLAAPPLMVNPLEYRLLKLSCRGEEGPPPATLAVAWTAIGPRGASTFLVNPQPLPDEPDTYVLYLSTLPRWVFADRIVEIKIIPGQAGNFQVSSLRLVQ